MPEFRRVVFNGIEQTVNVLNGRAVSLDGREIDLDSVQHLVPIRAGKIACVHLNYKSRLDELQWKQPPAPTYFWKPASCLNAHKADVVRPKGCKYLNYEGEIALIVGRRTRNIRPAEAAAYILGYAVANDMGLHDFRDTDANSMVRVKGSDTLGPIGPGIVTDWDFRDKRITTRVDGRIVQDSNTNELLWDPHYLLADLARSITFEAGDIILTGTPANSRPIAAGSTVTIDIDGLGRLENKIVDAEFGVSPEFGAQPTATRGVLSIALGSDYVE